MQWLRVDLKVALDLGEAMRPKLTLFKFKIQPDQLDESVARLNSVLPAFNRWIAGEGARGGGRPVA